MSDSLDQIKLRNEEVQAILTQVPNWMIRWGSLLVLIIFVLVLVLSWFIKYPDIIETEAIVTTKIPPQKEFASITAKFDSIYVYDSQKVSQNSVLGVLENTADTEDVFFLKSILDTIRFKDGSLEFPFDDLPILFLGDIDESFSLFENSYFQYLLNKQLKPFSNDATANKIALTELNQRLSSLNSQYSLFESELRFKKNELERNKTLLEKGVISQQEYETKELEFITSQRNLKNLNLSISQIRESIGGANKKSQGTQYSETREEMRLLKSTVQSYNQLKKSLKDWENTYVLKSEIEGYVSFLNYWDKNQTVMQGDLVFTVVPSDTSNYLAKIKAPSQNSGKIKVGQKVNIKLQNFPESEFGMLVGNVESISLAPDIEGFYLINVALPNRLVTSYNQEIEFKQEMRGTAEIITEDLRLLERFFYQFKELFDR